MLRERVSCGYRGNYWGGSAGAVEGGFQALSEPKASRLVLLENGMRDGEELSLNVFCIYL